MFGCSEYVRMILVRRANYLRTKARKLKGGVQRADFFVRFTVPASDVLTLSSLQSANATLSKKVEDLETKLKTSATLLRQASDEKQGRGRSRKHSLEDYSA